MLVRGRSIEFFFKKLHFEHNDIEAISPGVFLMRDPYQVAKPPRLVLVRELVFQSGLTKEFVDVSVSDDPSANDALANRFAAQGMASKHKGGSAAISPDFEMRTPILTSCTRAAAGAIQTGLSIYRTTVDYLRGGSVPIHRFDLCGKEAETGRSRKAVREIESREIFCGEVTGLRTRD